MRGYHVYQENWSATVGEELVCQRETGKIRDAFAVSVIRALPNIPPFVAVLYKGSEYARLQLVCATPTAFEDKFLMG